MTDTLQVSPDENLELVLPLSVDPIPLEPIVVVADRVPMPKRDYERRSLSRSVFLITREEIEERRPRFLSELLNRVPGGIVVATPPAGYTLLLRGQCRPGIWMDGVPVPYVSSIDQLLSPQDVEAVEVYHGFELPVEFGVNSCGGVLIWTRMGNPGQGGTGGGTGGFLSRLVMAAGLTLLVFFLWR